jgi:glyoxylase-like metal-dependent hydrolase (beta-lactamase superfamily II)
MNIENLAENSEDFTGNVWKFSNGETVLIDAGTGDSWQEIKSLEKVDKVVVTHSHYDHVDNMPKIKDKFDPEIYAFRPENLPVEAQIVSEDGELDLAGLKFQVFHTPGHKDDSICLYSENEKILFTGDLIFPEGGFGRTDLEEGDRDKLIESIEKVSDLEVEEFYPGHENAVGNESNKWIEKSLEEARKREAKY